MPKDTIRCSLRFLDNGLPVTVGFPFAKISAEPGALALSSHRSAGRFAVPMEAVTRAERTTHGVRVFVGDDQRFIVGHLLVGRLVDFLTRAGIRVDAAVTPATWTDVKVPIPTATFAEQRASWYAITRLPDNRRRYFRRMAESTPGHETQSDKAQRRAARELVATYHQEELLGLLEHVREGFSQLDAGQIDAFELDHIIHQYKKAATRLWSFCGSSGARWQSAATAITGIRERGESGRDWWEEAAETRRA